MKKFLGILLGAYCTASCLAVYAIDKFEILPDLPEPLAAAQASSVSTTGDAVSVGTQHIGQEPSLVSVVFSLLFVILLIYATGIIYAKLNKMGLNTIKKMGNSTDSRVTVVSTTPLGGNKTLHVVELDGKRMLIGASSNSIHLIKDLGAYPSNSEESGEISHIELKDIKIPKIEIPKISLPNFGFTKTSSAKNGESTEAKQESEEKSQFATETIESDNFEISDIYEEGPDGIIDKLFQTNTDTENTQEVEENTHKVDPDEYALYKKYL